MTTSAMAQTANTAPADLSFAFDDVQSLQVQDMSTQQMQETEGAIVPLYAIGVFATHTGRFIVTRYVSRTIAANAARSVSIDNVVEGFVLDIGQSVLVTGVKI